MVTRTETNGANPQFSLRTLPSIRRSWNLILKRRTVMNPRINFAARMLASLCFAMLVFCLPHSASAQEARGTIKGTVMDESKAAVPGATVKITNIAMGTAVTVPTNAAGTFQAPFLIPGSYRVEVTMQGFKTYVRDNVVVRVNDLLELDVNLEVGTVDQSVTVTGEGAVLETASASLGQVVDARRIAELPIAHGDAYAMIGLAAGTSFSRSLRLDRPFEPTHIVGYAMDGTRANRSDVTIDGISSTSTANAGEVISSYVPQQDIVQEFKVQTATFDAQFGNTEGGVTNLSIKSGTNAFHGTAVLFELHKSHLRQRFLLEPDEHAAGRLLLSPVWRDHRWPDIDSKGLRRQEQNVLHVRL